MSGHWRFCAAAFLLVAALSTSPASSNPLTDLFNPAPKEPDAPAPATEQCLPQPGRSSAPGQHWVYHLDGRRKCWFQVAEEGVPLKKPVQHHFAKRRAIAREENETGMRKQKAFVDARAQLPRSAPAEAQQPSLPAPEVVDAASVPANGAAALVPPEPVVADLMTQPAPERPRPRQLDVETLLAAVPLPSDTVVSSVPPPKPSTRPDADEDDWERMATQAGVALMTVGLFCLLGSLLARRFLKSQIWGRSVGPRQREQGAPGSLKVARGLSAQVAERPFADHLGVASPGPVLLREIFR